MTFVLDACAIIAYLRGEIGADYVENLILNEKCMVHAVNLCEVYYDCLFRGEDSDIADEFIEKLEVMGIESREDMDRNFWKMIAHRIRQELNKLLYRFLLLIALY